MSDKPAATATALKPWLARTAPMRRYVARQKGYLLVMAAACCWATSGIFTKQILRTYAPTPLALAFWRDGLTFALLFIPLGLFRRDRLRLDRKALLPLLGLGVISVGIFHVLWVYAVALIGPAPATVCNYTAPAFAVLLSWLVWREPITARKLGAVVLSFAGCVLAVRAYHLLQFQLNAAGFLAGLGTGITWATYPIFSKMLLKRFSTWTVVTYAFGLSALTLVLPQPVQTISFPWAQPAQVWLWLGLLALVPSVAGFCLYSLALNYLTASSAVITAALETLLAAILAYLAFGDTLEWPQVLGGVMILMAIAVLARQGSAT